MTLNSTADNLHFTVYSGLFRDEIFTKQQDQMDLLLLLWVTLTI